MFNVLRILNLETLDVKMEWEPATLYHCDRISAAAAYIEQIEIRTLAEKALEAAPTLRFIVFKLLCPEEREGYFCINPATNTLEELSEWEGEVRRNAA